MATIKSYTDINQSKKLAEILPLESADQTWARIAIAGANLDVPEELQYKHNGDMPFQYYSGIGIPCWSLAALMNYLKEVDYFPKIQANEYEITMSIDYQDKDEDEIYTINIYAESFVDACYEMIIRLNELKKL